MTRTSLLTCILLGALTVSLPAQTQTSQPAAAPSAADTAVPPIPTPAHPATVQQIHEYLTITHAIETGHKLMGQMVDAMQATSAPYFPKSFWDDMRTAFTTFDLETPIVPAYQRYFSEEDMQTVLTFLKSPAGQRYIQAQPLIVAATREQFRKEGAELGKEIYDRHKDEIEAAHAKYEQGQHPDSDSHPDSEAQPAPAQPPSTPKK